MTEQLCELSATDASKLIQNKDISPVELLESCIQQIEKTNISVNAIVTTNYHNARSEALIAEQSILRKESVSPLHGIPFGVKDLTKTKGVRTTFGSLIYKDYIPEKDDHIVSSLKNSGCLLLAKTNTPEFGAGGNTTNNVFGTTLNPYDLTKTSGGSSGGSAAALAMNMLPLATGSDTGGSLRIPASFCGVCAFRGSLGAVANENRSLALTTHQAEGPMARTVDDLKLMFDAMTSYNSRDPIKFPGAPFETDQKLTIDISDLRIAFSENLGVAPVSQEIGNQFRLRKNYISIYAHPSSSGEDIALDGAIQTFWSLRAVDFISRHHEFIDTYDEHVNPNIFTNMEDAYKMSATDIGIACREQMRLYQKLDKLFDFYDVLICPVVTIPPFSATDLFPKVIEGKVMENYVHWAALTTSLTVTGNPVVSIPLGVDSNGLPFGIQVVGRMHSDYSTLAAARAIERCVATSQFSKPNIPEPFRPKSMM